MRTLIKYFNFSFLENQKIGLIGEEGNGKSSLLKAIYNENLIEDYAEIKGSIFKQNERIGYLPQLLPMELNEVYIADYINQSYRDLDYGILYKYLSGLEINEELINNNMKLKELSGGEKIKVQLLNLLLDNPTVLLLDEPTNDLDMDSVLWLENFINKINIPVMFISHDEKLLENCANTIILFEQLNRKTLPKHTIYRGGYEDFLEKRWTGIVNQEKNAKKDREIFDKKLERYHEIYDKVERAQKNVSRQDPSSGKNLKDKMHAVKSMGKRFEREEQNLTKRPDYEEPIFIKFGNTIDLPTSKQVIDLKLNKLEVTDKLLSKNIELNLLGPSKVCIVGKNGSGKTTLLRDILNYVNPNLKVFYMPQNYLELMDTSKSPIDYLAIDSTKEELTRVRTYLGSLKFTKEEMERPIVGLSGGQIAKLYFSNLTSSDNEVLILDEPTRNISPLSGPEIRNALKYFSGAIISVSHDRKYIEEVCDRIFYLDEDGLREVNKEDYLNN